MDKKELIAASRILMTDYNRFPSALYEFTKAFWHEVVKDPFIDNWHIKFLCDRIQEEVERIAERIPKTKDLIVNISPRSLKSYIFSIMLCPWSWTKYPSLKFINSSYSHQLSTDHCLKGRRLIQSAWYQMHWGHQFELTGDQNAKSFYENDKGKARRAAYARLASDMGIDVHDCHIGSFDLDQCRQARRIVNTWEVPSV